MSKELEALNNWIKDYLNLCEKLNTNQQEKMLLDSNSPYNILKSYFESIKNAEPNKLTKKLENMYCRIDYQWLTSEEWKKVEKDYSTIRQFLIKAGQDSKKARAVDYLLKHFNFTFYERIRQVCIQSKRDKGTYETTAIACLEKRKTDFEVLKGVFVDDRQ